ncbi:AAA family ATPase [Microbacterium sp. NPDC056044]|uniref:AAA family ATPase n=1 Tax=Microbacterium sp. NPDC056044 TaxID=3345690 RepID=UPI0035DAFE05
MLELRLFGPPRVRRDGAEVRFDTRKAVALLAILAVSGHEHGREELAGSLWPDLDHVRSRAALRRTLSVATAVGPALVIGSAGVRLDPAEIRCDVREFRLLADSTESADWARAAELAAAGFLEGFSLRDSPVFDDWQIATAASLRDLASQTLARLVAASVARRDLAAAIQYARRRTQVEPLSEPAHADLIRVTAWSGDRPGALTAYRALVRVLDRELGVAPLPETLALQAQIRAGTLAGPDAGGGAAAAETRPIASPRVSRLVGRDGVERRLDGVWEAVPGRAIGLVGEPGIGKSVLLDALAQRAVADGVRVVRLAGHASERGLAYAAANDLVRGILVSEPDLAARLGAAGAPLAALSSEIPGPRQWAIRGSDDLRRVNEAVLAAVGVFGRAGRALIVVDDAHLIDPPSAALLGYLLRRLPPRVAVVAAWATGFGGEPLAAAVAEQGEVILVGPLEPADVATLLNGSPHDPAEVVLRTRGVPLLVTEYVTPEMSVDDPPLMAVRDVVAARFEGVSAMTRQVVAAAAVIGTVADPELLRVAGGRDENETVDAIEEAITRGLLVERVDQGGYDVPHDLVRDTAMAWMSLARARLLHGRIADLLARRHAVDPLATPAGAVARHLSSAGRDAEAVAWYLDAASAASRLSAHAEALELLLAARSLGLRSVDVHQGIGTELVRLGRYRDALGALDRAGALAEGDAERQAVIEHATAGVYDRLGEPALALSHLEAARDLIGDASSPHEAAVLADLALVEHRLGHAEAAERTAVEAERAATEAQDRLALARSENVLGVIAAARGDQQVALSRLRSAAQRAREVGDQDLLIASLNNLSRVYEASGELDHALMSARDALAGAERQGDRHRVGALHSHVADLLHAAGREDEAVAALKTSAALLSEVQDAQTRPALWTLAEW